MSRDAEVLHKIALLATGDEISQGDILNSNSQEIALRLVGAGMQVRMHAAAPDNILEIEQALNFLLETHQAVVITGGLGPTSDDLTRYALSNVVKKPLVFDGVSWERITTRLKKFGYHNPPESNRQQAFFPEGATVIPNPNGTAAGCFIQHDGKYIFMLPGPPIECLPMVESVVIEKLQEAKFQQSLHRKKWLLFGVSEGKIAEELDALTKSYHCVTGYRLWYPYIEFKIYSDKVADFDALVTLVEKNIQPYLLGDGKAAASAVLRNKLIASNLLVAIDDHATGGALSTTLLSPETYSHLCFTKTEEADIHITIRGLTEYWQAKPDTIETTLEMVFTHDGKQERIERKLPLFGKRVIAYTVEFVCQQINEFLTSAVS